MKHILIFLMAFLAVSPVYAQTVFLKPIEALRLTFHDSKEVVSETRTLTESQKRSVESLLKEKLVKDSWDFLVARSGGVTDGYALIDQEIGKTEPITFLTAMTPTGAVKEVEVLMYREPIGSEVHEKRFLKQYENKTASDPVRTGQDIANISGATLSARAVSVGVKRALVLWQVFYGGGL